MIAVYTSAFIAIAFAEPERENFLAILHRQQRTLISIPSVVKARLAVHGRRGQRQTDLHTAVWF